MLTGCSNKLIGDLSVNGEKLDVTSCRNAAAYGFSGLVLETSNQMKLIIAYTDTGKTHVVLLPHFGTPGRKKGVPLGSCALLEMREQHSTINNIRNVEGTVGFECTTDGYTVKGGLAFENCH